MAKAHAKKAEETEETPKAPHPKAKLGDKVVWSKQVGSSSGSSFETYLAFVVGFPKNSNFQAHDNAVNLLIFGQPGNPVADKQGVMFSEKPAIGRWSPLEE